MIENNRKYSIKLKGITNKSANIYNTQMNRIANEWFNKK